jgi:hypothetical protein
MPNDETLPDVTEISDLYALPLTQFTSSRDQLASRLRSEGRTEEADSVGKLRKPSVAVWALNRLARRTPEQVDQLLDSHRRLREADSMEAMQEASELRRQAVARLVEAAVAELGADGRAPSAQTRDRITRTLLAVATDPQGEAEMKAGRLVRELEPSGSGWGEIGLAPPASPDPSQGAVMAAERASNRAQRLEGEAADAEHQLEIAKRALTQAKRRAKEARAGAEQASEEARQAEEIARELGADGVG